LPGDLGRRYAAVSGDVNPIHLHPWLARALGFRRAIAHGMWTAAAMAAAVGPRLPDAVGYRVEFRRPVLQPATVRLFTALDGAAESRVELRGREGDDTVLAAGVFPPA
jgi:acyl dehydratase